jgi:uncharacterized protein YcnI
MLRSILAGAFVATLLTPAAAHVTLETQEAKVNAPYRAVLRVPHGCDKSATTAIRVRIPDGVIGVKPKPHSGWTLKTVTGKYPKPMKHYHSELTEGVVEISWSGGKLPDEWYDEFVFSGYISGELAPGTTLYFPVVQECEKGVSRWIEIPVAGQSHSDLPRPAPGLKLLPAAPRQH